MFGIFCFFVLSQHLIAPLIGRIQLLIIPTAPHVMKVACYAEVLLEDAITLSGPHANWGSVSVKMCIREPSS